MTGRETWGDEIEGLREPRADLAEDAKRLERIAVLVLSGVPIETFELGEYEIHVVVGYCQAGLEAE